MNEPMVRGILGKSGYFMMGFMPALIIAMVLVLTRTTEASRITYRNTAKSGKATLLMAVGSTSLGGGGANSTDTGLPPGVMPPGGMPGGRMPMPPGGLATAQSLGSRGPDTVFILYSHPPQGAEATVMGRDFEGDRFTIAAYRTVGNQGPAKLGATHLVALREAAFDVRLPAYDKDTLKEVTAIKNKYEEATKDTPSKPGNK